MTQKHHKVENDLVFKNYFFFIMSSDVVILTLRLPIGNLGYQLKF